MKLLIYLPALNEEVNIGQVIAGLPRSLSGVDCVEVLVVDDGSTDCTREKALACGAAVLSHGRNRGVGAALRSAVQYGLENSADVLVGMDADGQFDAKDIPQLIEPILHDRADMVMGSRFGDGRPANMPRMKFWGNSWVADLLGFISGRRFRDVSCGFRAYGRAALLRLNLFGDFTYTHETILSLHFQGLRVVEQPVGVTYYATRKSRVAGSLYSYAVQTSKIMFRVMLDYRPMRVFGGLAGLLCAVGLAFVLYMLGHYLLTGAFTPYKSFGFIGLGFVIFGALVFLIALVADMLNRLRRNQDSILLELRQIHYQTTAARSGQPDSYRESTPVSGEPTTKHLP